ncbi:MAG: hypothetical protein SWH61_05590 [Thermodesulfobacteriota bacterium]|nr:hypothetical protein [Thermodesulfobacteriota bacterium]
MTNEISSTTRVLILTANYRITGEIAKFSDSRLTDYINEARRFIAVTDAAVHVRDGGLIFKTPFLDVLSDSIEVITPADMVELA